MTRDLYAGGVAQVKAYRILQANVSEIVKDHGLSSVSEWLMLSYIRYNHNVTAKDLAALLSVEAPLATRLVTNLSEANLVAIAPHPTDKRAKIINTTAKAKTLVGQIEDALRQRLGSLLKGITSAELDAYASVLNTIIENGGTE